jgi:hypothetical protein
MRIERYGGSSGVFIQALGGSVAVVAALRNVTKGGIELPGLTVVE